MSINSVTPQYFHTNTELLKEETISREKGEEILGSEEITRPATPGLPPEEEVEMTPYHRNKPVRLYRKCQGNIQGIAWNANNKKV